MDDTFGVRHLLETATGRAVSFEDSQAFIDTLRVSDSCEGRFYFIENLVCEWELNECEAGDLSATAEVLWNVYGLRGGAFTVQLEMRAEVLKLAGSSVQELWDGFEKTGNERKDMGKETAS